MSSSFIAENKSVEDFDTNVSGSFMLGFLMKEIDCHNKELEKRYIEKYHFPKEDMSYAFEDVATSEFCKDAALKLKSLNLLSLFNGENQAVYKGSCECFEDFVGFVVDWIEFLEKCEGYKRL